MSRSRSTFRKGDLTRAIKAVLDAGVTIARVEVDGGKFIVIAGKGESGESPATEWDRATAELMRKQ